MRYRTSLIILAFAAFGCAQKGYHQTASRPASLPEVTGGDMGVLVDRELATACGIPSQQVFFEADEATLTEGDRVTLDLVASCVMEGPLAGAQLAVKGHAGPEGTDTDIQSLAQRRADAVARYLIDKGVATSQVRAEALGEDEAGARAAEEWPAVRRVDIVWVR